MLQKVARLHLGLPKFKSIESGRSIHLAGSVLLAQLEWADALCKQLLEQTDTSHYPFVQVRQELRDTIPSIWRSKKEVHIPT